MVFVYLCSGHLIPAGSVEPYPPHEKGLVRVEVSVSPIRVGGPICIWEDTDVPRVDLYEVGRRGRGVGQRSLRISELLPGFQCSVVVPLECTLICLREDSWVCSGSGRLKKTCFEKTQIGKIFKNFIFANRLEKNI